MTAPDRKPAVYNIAAGYSFADALAQGILERAADPLELQECTVLLPSRRACRTLRDAFLRLSGGGALLLPRLSPIGDVDADEVALFLAAEGDIAGAIGIPPAISQLERQLLLARLIEKKPGTAASFDQAVALAKDLGRFLDEAQTEGLEFDGLKNLVPQDFSEHWKKTLEFLRIVTEHWPAVLKERGEIDPALRRNILLRAQAEAWTRHPPQTPVIAAGSTGTVPAAAELLRLVSRLPRGMVVLPGLDQEMDEESWQAAGEDHPQFNMKKLLERLPLARGDVLPWPLAKKPSVNKARVRLLSEAMRPAATTEKWRKLAPGEIPQEALEGFSRIDCDTPQEEADVIALVMRETLEEKGRTAALITPDRRLARRVALSLRRWGIHIDDSGGQPLTEHPVGTWLMLTAEMAEEGLAPVALLSFLKHPFMAAELPPEILRDMVYLLDRAVLRGPRPSPGFPGLRDAIAALDVKREKSKGALLDWLDGIEPLMKGFTDLMGGRAPVPFRALLEAHIGMAESLATTRREKGAERLWRQEAGEAASGLLADLVAAAGVVPPLQPAHYTALLGGLLKSVTVRPRYGAHPRLSILGQIEARLFSADRVIIGGLNEGTWPALPDHDPWLSRHMRRDFGLPSPERSLSLAAHDFVQAASAQDVVITRAKKIDGTPAVPARWLLRIETVLAAAGLEWVRFDENRYRAWVRDLDRPAREPRAAERPAPSPPVAARPRKLRVTSIEKWMRDPYQIYAQYVLKLNALDPIDADPGAAERGTFIHAALEAFVRAHPGGLPADAAEKLLEFGRAAMKKLLIPREVEAFWWPRFQRIAHEFVEAERKWREEASPFLVEASGEWQFETPAGPFVLAGKADRIDRLTTGGYAVIDYKTGQQPRTEDVHLGLAPQLPLEGVMLRHGAFAGADPGTAVKMAYWRVTGGGKEPLKIIPVTGKDNPAEKLVEEAEQGIRALVASFDDEATPYRSRVRPQPGARASDYDHLARVKEWSISDDGEETA